MVPLQSYNGWRSTYLREDLKTDYTNRWRSGVLVAHSAVSGARLAWEGFEDPPEFERWQMRTDGSESWECPQCFIAVTD